MDEQTHKQEWDKPDSVLPGPERRINKGALCDGLLPLVSLARKGNLELLWEARRRDSRAEEGGEEVEEESRILIGVLDGFGVERMGRGSW